MNDITYRTLQTVQDKQDMTYSTLQTGMAYSARYYIQGLPKYSTHLFMTLYLLIVMDLETETAFILTPICVALK